MTRHDPKLSRKGVALGAREFTRITGVLAVTTFLAALSGCGGGGDGSSDRDAGLGGDAAGGGTCATLCARTVFDCTEPAGLTATATVDAPEADGCSGIIVVTSTEAPPFWIHCDRAEICTEHVDECFPATFATDSFAFTIPARAPITCIAR